MDCAAAIPGLKHVSRTLAPTLFADSCFQAEASGLLAQFQPVSGVLNGAESLPTLAVSRRSAHLPGLSGNRLE